MSIALAACGNSPGGAPGDGSGGMQVGSATSFATGVTPAGIAIVDLDGDGKPDLVIGNEDDDTIVILRNTTAAHAAMPSFAPYIAIATGDDSETPTGSPAIAVTDLDGDGKPDVVAGVRHGAIALLRNVSTSGSPAFAAHSDVASLASPTALAVADFNGDGEADVAAAAMGESSNEAGISVFLDAPPALSSRVDVAGGDGTVGVIAADLTGDGSPDLVIANTDDHVISVLANTTATGATTPSFTATAVGSADDALAFATADFNGDGSPDLAVVEDPGTGDDVIAVLLGLASPGTPSFASPAFVGSELSVSSQAGFATGDLDGDGMPDLVVADHDHGRVSVWLDTTAPSATTPTFSAATGFDVANPAGVAIGDLNGDGKPDLAITSDSTGEVTIVLGR